MSESPDQPNRQPSPQAQPACSVCFEAREPETVATLPCQGQHAFHADRITEWFKESEQQEKSPSCPLCRTEMEYECGCPIPWPCLIQDGITMLPSELRQTCGNVESNGMARIDHYEQCARDYAASWYMVPKKHFCSPWQLHFTTTIGAPRMFSLGELLVAIHKGIPNGKTELPSALIEMTWKMSSHYRSLVSEALFNVFASWSALQMTYSAHVKLDATAERNRNSQVMELEDSVHDLWEQILLAHEQIRFRESRKRRSRELD